MSPAPSAAFAYALALATETSTLAIARRAYQLWEAEGRPHGCDLQHWLRAEEEIGLELAEAIARSSATPEKIGTWTVVEARKTASRSEPGT
jgi:hypothetical protein